MIFIVALSDLPIIFLGRQLHSLETWFQRPSSDRLLPQTPRLPIFLRPKFLVKLPAPISSDTLVWKRENPWKPHGTPVFDTKKRWKTMKNVDPPLMFTTDFLHFFTFSVQDKSRRAQLERLQRQQERLEDLNTCGFQWYRNLKFGIYFYILYILYILLHTSTV